MPKIRGRRGTGCTRFSIAGCKAKRPGQFNALCLLRVKSGVRAFACDRSDLPFIADLLTQLSVRRSDPPIEFTQYSGRRLRALSRGPNPPCRCASWWGATRKFPKCWRLGALVKWSAGSERRTMKAPKPKQWAEQEIRRLVRLARQGVGVSKIATELGSHAGSVRRMARTMGILLKK